MRMSYSFVVDVGQYLLLRHGTALLVVVGVSHGVPHGVSGWVAGHSISSILVSGLHLVIIVTVVAQITTLAAVLVTRRELWV